jgi:hypothetical protein
MKTCHNCGERYASSSLHIVIEAGDFWAVAIKDPSGYVLLAKIR